MEAPHPTKEHCGDWTVPMGIEEHRLSLRSTTGGGVWRSPTMCKLNLTCAMPSAVMQSITVEWQNLPWYSSWDNITVTFIPVACSENAQWIAAAPSTMSAVVEDERVAMWVLVAPSCCQWRQTDHWVTQEHPFVWTRTSCHQWTLRYKHCHTAAAWFGCEAQSLILYLTGNYAQFFHELHLPKHPRMVLIFSFR
jgi:hypothetical protein